MLEEGQAANGVPITYILAGHGSEAYDAVMGLYYMDSKVRAPDCDGLLIIFVDAAHLFPTTDGSEEADLQIGLRRSKADRFVQRQRCETEQRCGSCRYRHLGRDGDHNGKCRFAHRGGIIYLIYVDMEMTVNIAQKMEENVVY